MAPQIKARRPISTAALVGLASLVAAAAQEGADAALVEGPATELPTVSVLTPPKPAYRSLGEAYNLYAEWARAWPESAELLDLGRSRSGQPLFGLRIGAPGGQALAERNTLLCFGGLDGMSLSGSEGVLAIAADLLRAPKLLPPDVAIVCMPWASPDGLTAQLSWIRGEGQCTLGRNGLPVDDDLDDAIDEDGPDDVDGDGRVVSMLVEDENGLWRRGQDPRFLVEYGLGQGPRYRLLREGRDDDGDGLFNEDGPGGVRLDRNFPYNWLGPRSPISPGPMPLSEPGSQAVAKLIESPLVFGAIFFEGSEGRLVSASTSRLIRGEEDYFVQSELGRHVEGSELAQLAQEVFQETVGTSISEESIPTVRVPGSPLTWALHAYGVPAMRVSTWGPNLGLDRSSASIPAGFTARNEGSAIMDVPRLMAEELGNLVAASSKGKSWIPQVPWTDWLDERRGGIGFVDWHPVELSGLGQVLVGGWESLTVQNPPEDQLAKTVAGSVAFVRGLLEALPSVSVEIASATRDGELCTISATARGIGRLPADFFSPGGMRIELVLPEGSSLIAGALEVDFAPAKSEAQSEEWLVFAPADALVRIQLVLVATGEIVASCEVRP